MAQRAMAMSYAFEANCPKSIEYEQKVFDYFGSVENFFQQGEIADEAARVCLDIDHARHKYPADDHETARDWYNLGRDAGLKEPNITPDRVNLWNFRWEHAQARLAAREGNTAQAQKHIASAKAILAKGNIPQQEQFFPYLEGYVAFFTRDYKNALDNLIKANQKDPFIQCLIAQTYEKLGDNAKALDYYREAFKATSHNPPAAYAVPFSRKKLATLAH